MCSLAPPPTTGNASRPSQALGTVSRDRTEVSEASCMMITALNIKHLSAAVFRPSSLRSLRAYRKSAAVLMTSQTGTQLDKSTPDNKWKEILSTEQVLIAHLPLVV